MEFQRDNVGQEHQPPRKPLAQPECSKPIEEEEEEEEKQRPKHARSSAKEKVRLSEPHKESAKKVKEAEAAAREKAGLSGFPLSSESSSESDIEVFYVWRPQGLRKHTGDTPPSGSEPKSNKIRDRDAVVSRPGDLLFDSFDVKRRPAWDQWFKTMEVADKAYEHALDTFLDAAKSYPGHLNGPRKPEKYDRYT